MITDTPSEIIAWWQQHSKDWFAQSPAFDDTFRTRYAKAHRGAAAGELHDWETSAEGCLALLILLDQYPRNAFRGTPAMYATDPQARAIARHAEAAGFIPRIPEDLRLFMLLPFSHSESFADQELAVAMHLYHLPSNVSRAEHHRDIIARFGRFPHRQQILGNTLTPDEHAYLRQGGFKG